MISRVEKLLLQFAKKHGPFNKVLDVGSLDVNGSVRKILKGQYKEIVGIDMRVGEGVDIVMNAHINYGIRITKPLNVAEKIIGLFMS